MSVHTYVGARYVPRFMGTYDPTQIYEALDVVDNGSGTSYIAQKIVPAGTPLTDTEYWFVYGASSGAIIQLQNDMIQAQNDITGLQGNVSGLLTDVGTLKTKTAKNLLVIGNSYVQRNVSDQLKGLFDTYHEYTYGGSGFLVHTGNTTTYEDLLDQAIADAALDKNSITDIIFVSAFGDSWAYQDAGGYSAYTTGLTLTFADIMTKIAANFPNCVNKYITLAESRNRKGYSEANYSSVFGVHKAFKQYCPIHGFTYLGWTGWNMMYTGGNNFEADDIHPTATGAKIIGHDIVNAYKGNLVYRTIESVANVPLYLCNASGDTLRVNCMITPDEVCLMMGYANVVAGVTVLNAGDKIARLLDLAVPPVVLNTKYFETDILSTNGNTRFGGMSCSLKETASSGVAELYLDTAIAASTNVGSSSPKFPGFQSITYKI